MNKKGLTLIELLAVIIILSVLALILVPTVSGIIRNARKAAITDSAYGLIDAANYYRASKNLLKMEEDDESLVFNIENDVFTLEGTEETLSYGGVTPKYGSILIDKKGVSIRISDGTYCAYKSVNDIAVNTIEGTCSDIAITGENEETKQEELTKTAKELAKETIGEMKDDLKKEFLDDTYPIGSIYISMDDTDPGDLFGGVWERFGKGKSLVGVDEEDDDFKEVEQVGGEKEHTLTIDEMPSHTHTRGTMDITGWFKMAPSVYSYGGSWHKYGSWGASGAFSTADGGGALHPDAQSYSGTLSLNQVNFNASTTWTGETSSVGGNGAHNNLQPYITVYMWKRIG